VEKLGLISGPKALNSPARISRRAIVAGLVLSPFALAACGAAGGQGSTSGATSSAPTDSPAPDESIRATCASAEADLIALYNATLVAYPDTAGLLTIRDEHAAHLEALGVSVNPFSAPDVATSQTQALKDLQKAEQAAAEARTGDCVAVGDAALARVIALIAASEAAHAVALGGGA
jgi:hypothetical protein